MHVSPDTRPTQLESLVARVDEEKSDVVVLTRDLVDVSPHQLRGAMAPLAVRQARLCVYAVTDNHDHFPAGDRWIEAFRAPGMRVLHNEHLTERDREGAFVIAGVPDWAGGIYGPAHRPHLGDPLSGRGPSPPLVLLAHQPRPFPEAAQHVIALQLTGHTHGGQAWPFTLLVGLVEKYVAALFTERGVPSSTSPAAPVTGDRRCDWATRTS